MKIDRIDTIYNANTCINNSTLRRPIENSLHSAPIVRPSNAFVKQIIVIDFLTNTFENVQSMIFTSIRNYIKRSPTGIRKFNPKVSIFKTKLVVHKSIKLSNKQDESFKINKQQNIFWFNSDINDVLQQQQQQQWANLPIIEYETHAQTYAIRKECAKQKIVY